MDVHVPRAITEGLRLRAVDVLSAQEDGAARFTDSAILDRASSLGRVLFTRDSDLLVEAIQRQKTGRSFAGVIFAHQLYVAIGQCVQDLELIAKAANPPDLMNRVQYLPLR
jgi:hypothetical protein